LQLEQLTSSLVCAGQGIHLISLPSNLKALSDLNSLTTNAGTYPASLANLA